MIKMYTNKFVILHVLKQYFAKGNLGSLLIFYGTSFYQETSSPLLYFSLLARISHGHFLQLRRYNTRQSFHVNVIKTGRTYFFSCFTILLILFVYLHV